MGGVGEPEVSIKLMAECSHGGLAVLAQKLLISDVVSGALASPFASVPVRNEGTEWIEILDITTKDVSTACSDFPAFADGYWRAPTQQPF